MRYAIPFLFVVAIISCKNEEKPINNFDNLQLLKIADFQDRRLGDSLIRYLEDSDPSYRIPAALAFASVQDSIYVDRLKELLLNDRDIGVRRIAAFALGQTQSLLSEQVLFESATKEKDPFVLAQVIESYGKVCKHWKLNLSPQDS